MRRSGRAPFHMSNFSRGHNRPYRVVWARTTIKGDTKPLADETDSALWEPPYKMENASEAVVDGRMRGQTQPSHPFTVYLSLPVYKVYKYLVHRRLMPTVRHPGIMFPSPVSQTV